MTKDNFSNSKTKSSKPDSGAPTDHLRPGELIDFAPFISLIKEMNHFLVGVHLVDNYQAVDLFQPLELTPEMKGDLGAESLTEFYQSAVQQEGSSPSAPLSSESWQKNLPLGPESIQQAAQSLEKELSRLAESLADLQKSMPPERYEMAAATLEERRNLFQDSRYCLMRAARLWPQIKGEAEKWLDPVRSWWQKAHHLNQIAEDLLNTARENGEELEDESARRAIGRAMVDIREELESARKLKQRRDIWSPALVKVMAELDSILAKADDPRNTDQDWSSQGRRLSNMLTGLTQEERRLADETPGAVHNISKALAALDLAEQKLSASGDDKIREQTRLLTEAAARLWRMTMQLRRELATIYLALPALLGKPIHLEKLFLTIGILLGRSQNLLEDLRHRLTVAEGRLPDTSALCKEAGEILASLAKPLPQADNIRVARRRLASFLRLTNSLPETDESFSPTGKKLPKASQERAGLNSGVAELNRLSKKIELLEKKLAHREEELQKAAEAVKFLFDEKNELTDRLNEAQESLGAVGHIKTRLLTALANKTALMATEERERWATTVERYARCLKQLAKVRRRLTSELAEAKNALTDLQAELLIQKFAQAESQFQNEDLTLENRGLVDTICMIIQERETLTERLADLAKAQATQEEQLAQLTKDSEATTAERDQLAELVERLESEKSELSEKIKLSEEIKLNEELANSQKETQSTSSEDASSNLEEVAEENSFDDSACDLTAETKSELSETVVAPTFEASARQPEIIENIEIIEDVEDGEKLENLEIIANDDASNDDTETDDIIINLVEVPDVEDRGPHLNFEEWADSADEESIPDSELRQAFNELEKRHAALEKEHAKLVANGNAHELNSEHPLPEQVESLAKDRQQLYDVVQKQQQELNTLKQEMAQADRDLAESDGRLEAAWAAMNYLGTRSSDALKRAQDKLEKQARELDNLNIDLKRSQSEARENQKDALGLLYFMLLTKHSEAAAKVTKPTSFVPNSTASLPSQEEEQQASKAVRK